MGHANGLGQVLKSIGLQQPQQTPMDAAQKDAPGFDITVV
ncbi:uncharacterized protein METZ01_LOCUS346205, partial [marine metagenome]